MSRGVSFDFIGSDAVDGPELHNDPRVNYLNLRNQRTDAGLLQKMTRVLVYYVRLICYALTAKPRIFHILWNNKFEWFDRVLLMVYYKLLGKTIIFTAHNVNAGTRDGSDSFLNRLTLKIQYRLCDHIFVHTQMMRRELVSGFGVSENRVSVVPYGINNKVPDTALTRAGAREKLGLDVEHKVVLFFGMIAPYKGLEYLVEAMATMTRNDPNCRLVIAGLPKNCPAYWEDIKEQIGRLGLQRFVIQRIEFLPDSDIEVYFKAADVFVLPYTFIFQSGVLFLGYYFGLPVIATDVGSLKEDIISGETGLVCQSKDAAGLARALDDYFSGSLYRQLNSRRETIRSFAAERYSWAKNGELTQAVYERMLKGQNL